MTALRILGIAVFCILLTLFFMLVRFPYEQLRGPLEDRLRVASGADVSLGELRGGPSIGLIGLHAGPVRLTWPDGTLVAIDSVALRPAWSTSWLRGEPALHTDVRAEVGNARGAFWPSIEEAGFSGRIEDVDLSALPTRLLPTSEELGLVGRLDADLDVTRSLGRIAGTIDFEAREGAVITPGSGIPLPYEALSGHIELAQDGSAALRDWTLSGPLLSASLAGTVGASAQLLAAPLDVTLQVRVDDDGARRALTPLGVETAADGTATLHVGGSLSAPTLE
jgi:type II secretion system protein N